LYLNLLVIPWVITCVVMFRPVGKPSYDNLTATKAYTEDDAQSMQRWLQAAHAMNAIATVLALPVLSSLLAQAAVRYTQRQSNGRTLNLGQLFALADRGWADIPMVIKSLSSPRVASPLLLLGALLSLAGESTTSLTTSSHIFVQGYLPRYWLTSILLRSPRPTTDSVHLGPV
jgi:hypothetical protein